MSKAGGKAVVNEYKIPKEVFEKARKESSVTALWTDGEMAVLKQCLDKNGRRVLTYPQIAQFLIDYGGGTVKRTRCAIECKLTKLRAGGDI